MNYLSIYNDLILKRRNEPLSKDVYGENHHVIPRCMGGTDEKQNIVRLTAREHYIAHALLFKHYRTLALAHAWYKMLRVGKGQKREFTAAQYELAKKARSKKLSEEKSGPGNHFYGKTHSEETKKLLSESRKKQGDCRSQKSIDEWIERARQPKSEEHKSKIGRKGLTMLQNIHTLEIIRGKREDYDTTIWVNPRKITPEEKNKCQYCDIITNNSNLKRWHNDNCKHNPRLKDI